MKYTLRPYQEAAVQASVDYLQQRNSGNGIVILPTGSGKSLCIANTIYRLGAPTLVFQPTKEILEQNVAKMESYGYRPSIYSASAGQKRIGEITFATIGSVKNIPDLFKQFRYILVDECHFVNSKGGMYKEFIEQMEHVQVLGFTATPYRLAVNSFGAELRFLTRTRPRIFKDVVYYVQNKTLFDSGHLARLEYVDVKGFNRSALKMNSTGAEFDDDSVKKHCQESAFTGRVMDAVRTAGFLRKNVLVFTRFIEESQRIVQNIPNAAIVTGETPKRERERILSAFKSGQIRTVCNVGVLTTGFDFPELETIILSRPTMSLGLYYQMIGRGIRPHLGKAQCQVIDLCGNYRHFGKVEDLRIVDGGNGKWFIASGDKQLTNVQNATAYSEMKKKQRFVPGRFMPSWARR